MLAIETCGLTRRYGGITAVDGLNLRMEQGSLYALLGVNGAGKSTAIRMLCGLERPDGGSARIMGLSITDRAEEVRRIVAVSPQESAVAPRLSAAENLELIAGICGADRREARRRRDEMIGLFGLDEIEGRRAGTLSGGWQRRLSIAMAMITRPKLLFLDEPTLGLDVLARRALWSVIEGMKGETSILLTTHYMEEAEALSDCIGILQRGRLAAEGTAQALIARTGARNFEEAFVALAAPEVDEL